jgi:AcrR family transcriptional regulator
MKMDRQVQSLTAKGRATCQRIIEGAAALIRSHGVSNVTLEDIMTATQTSKSQVFHYFPGGKEQLLLAVAKFESQMVIDDQQPHLSQLVSWAAWQRWRDVLVDRYRNQGQNCPIAVLMSEIGRTTPGAQAVTAELMNRWHGAIAAGVRTMQGRGQIDVGVDPDQSAAALLAGIQGGVGVMLATGDLSYLEAALDVGIAALRR